MAQVLFRHTCAGCGKRITVQLDIEALTVQESVCTYCAYRQLYDNRQGRLRDMYRQALATSQQVVAKVPLKTSVAPAPQKIDYRAVPLPPVLEAQTEQGLVKPTREKKIQFQQIFSNRGDGKKGFRLRSLVKYFAIMFLAAMVVLPFILWVWLSSYTPGTFYPYMQKLSGETPNRIFDRNGIEAAQLLRQPVGQLSRKQIPWRLEELLLHVEDRNFWTHGGIDYGGILRAGLRNLFRLRFAQGGSTLTQQLARTLMAERQKTIPRKVKELAFARYLESQLTKDEILTHYVNRVYLGHGAWGFSSAARFYFHKELAECNDTEVLLLVALPPAPERYSPLRNPALLQERLNILHDSLPAKMKQKFSRQVFESQLQLVLQKMNRSPGESVFGERLNRLPWLSEYVRLFIQQQLGEEFTHDAGLQIETTVDLPLMEHAARVSENQTRSLRAIYPPVRRQGGATIRLPETIIEMRRRYQEVSPLMSVFGQDEFAEKNPELQTASVGLLNGTGEILFFVGGSQFRATNQLNRAFQMRRQTGSAIKPFIYAGAVEQGLLYPGTILEDSPVFFDQGGNSSFKKGYWLPENISGVYEGQITARRALSQSKNTVAVKIGHQLGTAGLAEIFRKFFFYSDGDFQSRFRADASIAIGTIEMSPLELALGFSAFANNGEIERPFLIRKITNREGKVLYDSAGKDELKTKLPKGYRAIPGDVAEVMASMLADSAAAVRIRGNVIGKTGTTNESRDAWFVGATPDVTAVVWVGYDDARYSMAGGLSAAIAAPLWSRIMERVPSKKTAFVFSPRAESVTVCVLSGELATSQCKVTRQEIATEKSRPTKVCDRHTGAATTVPVKADGKEEKDFW